MRTDRRVIYEVIGLGLQAAIYDSNSIIVRTELLYRFETEAEARAFEDRWYSDETELRRRYRIPEDAIALADVEGLKIGYSELAMHTRKAGKLISRIWAVNNGSYGYGLLADGSFIHGCLNIHSDTWVSFS